MGISENRTGGIEKMGMWCFTGICWVWEWRKSVLHLHCCDSGIW